MNLLRVLTGIGELLRRKLGFLIGKVLELPLEKHSKEHFKVREMLQTTAKPRSYVFIGLGKGTAPDDPTDWSRPDTDLFSKRFPTRSRDGSGRVDQYLPCFFFGFFV